MRAPTIRHRYTREQGIVCGCCGNDSGLIGHRSFICETCKTWGRVDGLERMPGLTLGPCDCQECREDVRTRMTPEQKACTEKTDGEILAVMNANHRRGVQ